MFNLLKRTPLWRKHPTPLARLTSTHDVLAYGYEKNTHSIPYSLIHSTSTKTRPLDSMQEIFENASLVEPMNTTIPEKQPIITPVRDEESSYSAFGEEAVDFGGLEYSDLHRKPASSPPTPSQTEKTPSYNDLSANIPLPHDPSTTLDWASLEYLDRRLHPFLPEKDPYPAFNDDYKHRQDAYYNQRFGRLDLGVEEEEAETVILNALPVEDAFGLQKRVWNSKSKKPFTILSPDQVDHLVEEFYENLMELTVPPNHHIELTYTVHKNGVSDNERQVLDRAWGKYHEGDPFPGEDLGVVVKNRVNACKVVGPVREYLSFSDMLDWECMEDLATTREGEAPNVKGGLPCPEVSIKFWALFKPNKMM